MSFDLNNFSRISATGNDLAPILYSYISTDPITTIEISGYFDNLMQDLTNGVGIVKKGDILIVEGASDAHAILRFASVTPTVTTELFGIDALDVALSYAMAGLTVNGNSTLGASTKLSQNLVRGRLKLDVRPTGGTTEDYAYQIRSESGKTSGADRKSVV